MGNCIERWATGREEEEEEEEATKSEERSEQSEVKKEGGTVKMKLVMTKGELEWLLLRLGEKTERKKLDDVLREMGWGGAASAASEAAAVAEQPWRPTLDSITEVPEVQSFHHSPL